MSRSVRSPSRALRPSPLLTPVRTTSPTTTGTSAEATASLHDKGLCNYIPLLYHEGPSLYSIIDTDVFMVKVAPMDAQDSLFQLRHVQLHHVAPQPSPRRKTWWWRSTRTCPTAWAATRSRCTSRRGTYIVE